MQQQNFWINITVYLLKWFHMVKKVQWKLWNILKNGHSEDDKFSLVVKLKISRE